MAYVKDAGIANYFDEEKYPLGKYLYHSIDENEL